MSAAKKQKTLDTDALESNEHQFNYQKEYRSYSNALELLHPFSKSQIMDFIARQAISNPSTWEALEVEALHDAVHCKIYIKGLAWKTTTEMLLNHFSKYGKIQEGTVVHDSKSGKSKGFGFVTFVDRSSAQSALRVSTQMIDGREITCRLASDPNHSSVEERRIFVSGLSSEATEESLRRSFRVYGSLESVRVIRDRDTGLSKRYGFIVYEYSTDARKLLRNTISGGVIMVDGRNVTCKLAAANIIDKRQSCNKNISRGMPNNPTLQYVAWQSHVGDERVSYDSINPSVYKYHYNHHYVADFK